MKTTIEKAISTKTETLNQLKNRLVEFMSQATINGLEHTLVDRAREISTLATEIKTLQTVLELTQN